MKYIILALCVTSTLSTISSNQPERQQRQNFRAARQQKKDNAIRQQILYNLAQNSKKKCDRQNAQIYKNLSPHGVPFR